MKKVKSRHQAADVFALNEAYDRLDMATQMVGSFLVRHPGIIAVPSVAEKVDDALTSLDAAHDEIAAVQLLQEMGPAKPATKPTRTGHSRPR